MPVPRSHPPPIELRDYILGYGVLDIPEGVDEPYFSPPLGLSGFIIITLNTQNRVVAKIQDRDHFTAEAVAAGQITCPVHGRQIGRTRALHVYFHPLGMHQLFGTNMESLTNTSMPLAEFLDADEADALVSSLKADQDEQRQLRVLNDFFATRTPKVNGNTRRLRNVLEYAHSKKGDVSIAELKDFGHYERKTLERLFKRMVGISPKVYCKIYRFKCLVNLIESQPNLNWAQLTEQAGFYDQSHMSRYFKEYLKVSPTSIVQLDMGLINHLLTR